jgi:hypothetical protein
MTETREIHEISTIEDMALLFARLPADRGELMLKEMVDAVRMIAPIASGVAELGGHLDFMPVRWVNDTKGTAKVSISTTDGVEVVSVSGQLPGAGGPA